MAGLELRFGAGDRLIVNGAAIQFTSEARIRFANKVEFLYGRQIMGPHEATTPARRIYFALQTAYIGSPEERGRALESAAYFIEAFAAETTSNHARNLLALALAAAKARRGHESLKLARRIIRHEDTVLAEGPDGPEKRDGR
ncbi:flagellar biosynthesis repressor FlbT [Acidomonas methanolica]|uniref:Flagellar biosynthesis regulator FlbT n=1 Tax=Acidomonas methanolica NBRC 104435 TaxID=1231351 RepID=A0A023D2A0_ACIMT|nr:flagellar biosynthesis repressor FlbT [Acidomonas methanolica]MBU2655199.1 flagellar biosynthesis repressor FlbT [Acidomonas methanolica]TCS24726.1 flagellar protein FlbT [Acidomonas methanolica]GAJ28252.1 flagellar biosynthesis regulator FlbT [Acidomonas methanolica NBRC 104435]GBQ59744.1 flagellar biosynthesis regulator FlbT [Acidomonas methanolica]GEK98755.1 hypothetical protein AME01nite_12540 [Acidomonas methanolica NBRC 104435]